MNQGRSSRIKIFSLCFLACWQLNVFAMMFNCQAMYEPSNISESGLSLLENESNSKSESNSTIELHHDASSSNRACTDLADCTTNCSGCFFSTVTTNVEISSGLQIQDNFLTRSYVSEGFPFPLFRPPISKRS